MRFDLTPAQSRLVSEIRASSAGILDGPLAAAPDEAGFREAWQKAAARGLTGLCVARRYRGGGYNALDSALALEALGSSRLDIGFGFAIAAHLFACTVPIAGFGSPALRRELLPALAAEGAVAANAMTEADAGSDVSRLATTAELLKDGSGYRLNGAKSFVSNGTVADVLLTYAATDPAAGYLGVTCFAVDRGTPGVVVGEQIPKPGLHGCLASTVTFQDCVVPARRVVGRAGQGNTVFRTSMAWERACLPALYLGSMQTQLEECVRHARERRQFDRPLIEFQAVSHRLAEMRLRLDGARWLLYRACWLSDRGSPEASVAAAMSKVAVSEAAVANGLDAVRLYGARAYDSTSGITGTLTDALPATIFSGTSDIQRELIVNGLGP